MLDAAGDALGALALGLGDQAELGAQGRRVADVADLLERERGDEPDPERAPDRDVVSEPAGQHQLGDLLAGDPGHVLEHRHARGDGALGQLDLADVVLRQHDLRRGAGLAGTDQDELALLAADDHALPQAGREPVAVIHLDEPGMVDDARVEHPRQGVDDAGAADAEGRGLPDRVDLDVGSDRDSVDGPQRPAHPVPDLSPFQGRAGGGRARPEVSLRTQQNLAIGADVHGDPDLGTFINPRGEGHGHRVGAHEAGDDREQADPRLGVHLEEEVAGGDHQRVAHDGSVGRQAHVGGVDAEEDVVHAGIADDHHLVDPFGEDAGLADDLLHVLVQEPDDPGLELPEIGGVELGEGDPGHEVAAEDRLRIQARDRGELLSGLQLDEGADHAGRPDVHGEAELHEGRVALLDGEHLAPERGDRDFAAAFPERGGEISEERGGDVFRRASHRVEELFEVGRLVVLFPRKGDLEDLLGDPGIDDHPRDVLDSAVGTEDLERLLVQGRGDLHGEGLRHVALAGEAVAFADEVAAELELVHDGGRRNGAPDELHPAGGAAPAPAAGRGDVDPARLRRLEDRGAGGDLEMTVVGEDGEGDRHARRIRSCRGRL